MVYDLEMCKCSKDKHEVGKKKKNGQGVMEA